MHMQNFIPHPSKSLPFTFLPYGVIIKTYRLGLLLREKYRITFKANNITQAYVDMESSTSLKKWAGHAKVKVCSNTLIKIVILSRGMKLQVQAIYVEKVLRAKFFFWEKVVYLRNAMSRILEFERGFFFFFTPRFIGSPTYFFNNIISRACLLEFNSFFVLGFPY